MTARADEVLAEAARLRVSIRPGSAPGKVKLTGPAEAVQRLTPLVARHKAELLEVLTGRQAAPEPSLIAANRRELERMAARVQRGEALGLTPDEADLAADRLLHRDRDLDDRRLCIECAHIRTSGTGWRCAALGPIPRELVIRLQRCAEFKGVSRD